MAAIKPSQILTIKNIALLLLCMFSVAAHLGGPIFYGVLIIYVIYNITGIKGKKKYHSFTVCFILIAYISLLVNFSDTEKIFRPEQRSIMLTLVLFAFSPLITNVGIYKYRKNLFFFLLFAISITSLISSCEGLFLYQGFIDGYLVGLYDFPNSLGYAQGLTIIVLFSIIAIVPKRIKYLCFLGILITIVAIPRTGTRTAFYSLPIIILGYAFLKSTSFGKFFNIVLMFILFSSIFFNYVKLDTAIIDRKNETQQAEGNSRKALWNARMIEFNQSPIIGFGTFRADLRYAIVNKNGNIEAGNSFLMMLSMNGLLGFLNFCLLYLSILIPFIKHIISNRKYGLSHFEIMLSLVLFYNFISMQQMGLLLNSGLYFTGINWLTLALAYKFKSFNQKR